LKGGPEGPHYISSALRAGGPESEYHHAVEVTHGG
jgi:hypothetical protein